MKLIGRGNTADVYEYEDNKVLKLYHKNYPRDLLECEYHNAQAINELPFQKPKAYELVEMDGMYGIIYDRVDGETLYEWLFKTYDVLQCAKYMASLHKNLLECKVEGVQSYKDFLRWFLLQASEGNDAKREELLTALERLEDGDTLCHGDFHPGNILISDKGPTIIDFLNVCCGCKWYDIARTVYLLEYTPVDENAQNAETIRRFKKELTECYLREMQVTRDEITDYLNLIKVARKVECPNE